MLVVTYTNEKIIYNNDDILVGNMVYELNEAGNGISYGEFMNLFQC